MGINGGYNYNMYGEKGNIANPMVLSNPQEDDRGAFRLLYVGAIQKYLLMPICAYNGYRKTLSYSIQNQDVGLYPKGETYYQNLFF